jgi:hypothetical protein
MAAGEAYCQATEIAVEMRLDILLHLALRLAVEGLPNTQQIVRERASRARALCRAPCPTERVNWTREWLTCSINCLSWSMVTWKEVLILTYHCRQSCRAFPLPSMTAWPATKRHVRTHYFGTTNGALHDYANEVDNEACQRQPTLRCVKGVLKPGSVPLSRSGIEMSPAQLCPRKPGTP